MSKKAVILSGGLGTRLKPFTDTIPKPLLPIGEKAVLEIQIERLVSCGFNEVILATNYKSEYIEKFFGDGSRYGVKLTISKEDEPLGTAGPVKLLENVLDEPFLVMNGDILSLIDFNDLYQFAISQKSNLTVGIKKIILPYAFGNIFFEGDRVIGIEEKPDIVTYALAGIYIMKPDILRKIPTDTYYGIDKLIHSMLVENELITKYEVTDYWLDIGSVDDYERAQKEYMHFT
jgi:NDP-sugar pyrophosphorylase family protein